MSNGKIRAISSSFWTDPYVRKTPKDVKLLYLYLLTNTFTNMLGIYEMDLDQAAFDLNINKSDVEKAMQTLINDGKVVYYQTYVMIVNRHRHQSLSLSHLVSAANSWNAIPPEGREYFSNGLFVDEVSADDITDLIAAVFNTKTVSSPVAPKKPVATKRPSQIELLKSVLADQALSDAFYEAMEEWFAYKRERKDAPYKERGMKGLADKILDLSGGSSDIVKQIVKQSISNNWVGLFAIKDGVKKGKRYEPSKTLQHELGEDSGFKVR